MSKVFVIAEAACTWLHAGLEGAFRSIQAAKDCGADAWKTQWTSDPEAMAMRRGVARDKYTRLGWAGECLPKLRAECERVGIEFLCTTFIPKDVALVAPYVSRFKVSAFESMDTEHLEAHRPHSSISKPVIVSINRDKRYPAYTSLMLIPIYCVSNYPTKLEDLKLSGIMSQVHGISDHTVSTLTGAVAVGSGRCEVIEKHVRLSDTPSSDPDYGHSLVCDYIQGAEEVSPGLLYEGFREYVRLIREAERML